ncbi:MAG: ACP S-malonyltransferase [Anaerolineales bacterium]|nr:ACP S-malonyltransferase [Anaerolineales bacterium]
MPAFDPRHTAFVFPGQGSQMVGMGRELVEASPAARRAFAEADEVLGYPLSRLCWEGPETDLNATVHTQTALLTCSIAALRAAQEKLGDFQPAFMAGHSVGEVTALVAAASMTFTDSLRLVRARGEAMAAAGERAPGGMAAILGLDAPVLEEVCAQAAAATGGVVQVANDNCPGQVVISGEVATLEKAIELAKARGAKRAMRLAVSIAAHSPLMASGAEQYARAVAATPIQPPRVPVISNITARPLPDAAAIRSELPAQLTTRVRWTDSVRYLLAQGISTFIEFGSKDVLTNLLKRIDGNAAGIAVNGLEGLAKLETGA